MDRIASEGNAAPQRGGEGLGALCTILSAVLFGTMPLIAKFAYQHGVHHGQRFPAVGYLDFIQIALQRQAELFGRNGVFADGAVFQFGHISFACEGDFIQAV